MVIKKLTYTLPNAKTKNDIALYGYDFGGWYTTPDFKEDTRIEEIPANSGDYFRVYAKWTLRTDTLYYEIFKAPVYAEIIAPEWIVSNDDITLAVKIYRADTGEEITSEYSTYQYAFLYSKNDSSGHTKQDNYTDVLNLNVDPGDAVYLWVHVHTMDGKYHEFTSDTPIELKATSTSDLLAKLENAIAGLDTDDIGALADRVKALETAMA